MAFSLGTLFEAVLLIINAIAILSEERFLSKGMREILISSDTYKSRLGYHRQMDLPQKDSVICFSIDIQSSHFRILNTHLSNN